MSLIDDLEDHLFVLANGAVAELCDEIEHRAGRKQRDDAGEGNGADPPGFPPAAAGRLPRPIGANEWPRGVRSTRPAANPARRSFQACPSLDGNETIVIRYPDEQVSSIVRLVKVRIKILDKYWADG